MTVDDTGSGTGTPRGPHGRDTGGGAGASDSAAPDGAAPGGGRGPVSGAPERGLPDLPDRSEHGGEPQEDGGQTEPKQDPLALRIEGLILGAERRYTPFQAARAAGVSMELASRFWRAMGFADIGQAKALTEADVLALRRLAGLVEAGLLSEAMAVQVARSTGQTTARLAEWQIDSFLEGLTEPPEPGMTRTEVTYPPDRKSVV